MNKLISDNLIKQDDTNLYVCSSQVLYDIIKENKIKLCYDGQIQIKNNVLTLMYLDDATMFSIIYDPYKKTYATHFKDGTIITDYLACAYAEGFCEGEEAIEEDIKRAWSYIIGTRLYFSLQGWYGRTVHELVNRELFDKNGTILKEN